MFSLSDYKRTSLTSLKIWWMLNVSKGLNRFFKPALQKTRFIWIMILFMDMKSQTYTRQKFPGRNISNLNYCGNWENRVAYIW